MNWNDFMLLLEGKTVWRIWFPATYVFVLDLHFCINVLYASVHFKICVPDKYNNTQ